MAEKTGKTVREALKETIQLERDQIREKIKELIDAQYSRLEEEAERIAPDFDYETDNGNEKS
jgi:F0F1-type ATP synthase membrane subunit b/b'